MNVTTAFFVFGLLIIFLFELKADLFIFVFGISTYLFLLVFIFSSDPVNTLLSLLNFFISNPLLGIIILLSPLAVYESYKKIKEIRNKDNKRNNK